MLFKATKTVKQRLLEKISIDPITGCWIWTASRNPQGYGKIIINRKDMRAHRVSYQEHIGEIPDGLWVLHKCDVPSCINPDHLFVGTRFDNGADMAAKGRSLKGEASPVWKGGISFDMRAYKLAWRKANPRKTAEYSKAYRLRKKLNETQPTT